MLNSAPSTYSTHTQQFIMSRNRSGSLNDIDVSRGGWEGFTGGLSAMAPSSPAVAPTVPETGDSHDSVPTRDTHDSPRSPGLAEGADRPRQAVDASAHHSGLHALLASTSASAAASSPDTASLFRTDEEEAFIRDDAAFARELQERETSFANLSLVADKRAALLCSEEHRTAVTSAARASNRDASIASAAAEEKLVVSKRAARAAKRAAKIAASKTNATQIANNHLRLPLQVR